MSEELKMKYKKIYIPSDNKGKKNRAYRTNTLVG